MVRIFMWTTIVLVVFLPLSWQPLSMFVALTYVGGVAILNDQRVTIVQLTRVNSVFVVAFLVAAGACAASIVSIVQDQPSKVQEFLDPPTICILTWLCFASVIIRYAQFELAKVLRDRARIVYPYNKTVASRMRRARIDIRRCRPICAVFSLLGLLSIVLQDVPRYAHPLSHAFHALVIAVGFYYAGVGIAGASSLARTFGYFLAESRQTLIAFHRDRIGGLGPVQRVADTASLLVLTGVLALPMGVRVIVAGLRASTIEPHLMLRTVGEVTALLATTAIVIWACCSCVCSLWARARIASVVEMFKHEKLTETARMRQLVVLGVPIPPARNVDAEESMLDQLRSGVTDIWTFAKSTRNAAIAMLGLAAAIAQSMTWEGLLTVIKAAKMP